MVAPFRKALDARHILAIALGGTISSSYFLGNGYVLHEVGPFAFLTFILGGFITYLTMECLAELAASEGAPRHPSFVSYAEKLLSPTWACGVGWAYWTNWVIYICVECIAGGILLHAFTPVLSVYVWSMLCCTFVLLINLGHVRLFGNAAFGLTFTHIGMFFGFSLLAILIYFGWIGTEHPFLGTRYLLQDGAFPNGITVLFVNMVIMLLNFQGTEIIGLSASEARLPKKDIPIAMRKISLSVTALYLIPLLLLALIFPWKNASLSESVFAVALDSYGLTTIAKIFTLLIVAGSLSCANSGLYAAVRSIHALAEMKIIPPWFQKLNKYGMPYRPILLTFILLIGLLQFTYIFSVHQIYITYLTLAGFIGASVWVIICICQLLFRKTLTPKEVQALPYKIPYFPYLTYFAIAIQVICLTMALFSADLRPSFYIGIPAYAIPMLWYKWKLNRST